MKDKNHLFLVRLHEMNLEHNAPCNEGHELVSETYTIQPTLKDAIMDSMELIDNYNSMNESVISSIQVHLEGLSEKGIIFKKGDAQ